MRIVKAIFFNVPELKPGIVAKIQSNLVQNDKQLLILDRRRVILSIFYSNLSSQASYFETRLAELRLLFAESKQYDRIIKQKIGGEKRDGKGKTEKSNYNRDLHLVNNELRSMTKKYEKFKAKRVQFHELDFQKSVAVVGYTNAGKSSLIKLVTNKLDRYTEIVEDKISICSESI